MKRIVVVLRAADAATVRKAAFTAGTEWLTITPVSRRESANKFEDWRSVPSDQQNAVRLDVIVDDNNSDRVVSAILSSAQAGAIEKFASINSTSNALPLRRQKVATRG